MDWRNLKMTSLTEPPPGFCNSTHPIRTGTTCELWRGHQGDHWGKTGAPPSRHYIDWKNADPAESGHEGKTNHANEKTNGND